MKTRSSSAYLMLLSSMLIFGSIGIFRRFIPLSSAFLACFRGFFGAFVLFLYLRLRKDGIGQPISRRDFLLLFVSGAAMGFNWVLLFEAYHYTSVSVATLCYYMEPTIVILLSPLLFREKLGLHQGICVLLSLFGMVLVSGLLDSGSGTGDFRGVLLGLGAALLYAAVVILNKKIPVEDAYQKTVLQLFFAAFTLLPYLLLTEDFRGIQLDVLSLGMLLLVGLVHTGLAYTLYFSSIKRLPAQSIAVLSYLDPVSAMLLSALILREQMSLSGILGAVLIIGSALYSELK